MKIKFNLKPSQEYTNESIKNITLYLKKMKHSENYIYIIFIFFIKYSLSYKHISRGHISP